MLLGNLLTQPGMRPLLIKSRGTLLIADLTMRAFASTGMRFAQPTSYLWACGWKVKMRMEMKIKVLN
jgi:hypothetical protein